MSATRPYPILDWVPRHDPRSRLYPIRALIGAVTRVFKVWPLGPVLDQGQEGACVGHGWTNEATAGPVRIDFADQRLGRDDLGVRWARTAQAFAFQFYFWCQRHDIWPGEAYSGTSVLAGAKGMRRLGFFDEYRWAFGLDDVIDTIVARGPVVLGVPWYSGMYSADGGELTVTGTQVGGHCILAYGFDPEHVWADGTTSPGVALYNSWGPGWGIDGTAWVRAEALGWLLEKGGEACVPIRRANPTPLTALQRIVRRVKTMLAPGPTLGCALA